MKAVKKQSSLKIIPTAAAEAKQSDVALNGKGLLDASLMTVIKKILDDDIHSDCFDSPDEKKQRRSLRWNLSEVISTLLQSDPQCWFFDSTVHQYTLEYRQNLRDTAQIESVIYDHLRRRPKLRNRLLTAWNKYHETNEAMALTTGFLLGLNAYQNVLAKNLDGMNLSQVSGFTIEYPLTEAKQKATGTD
jgi:hypothetical protein